MGKKLIKQLLTLTRPPKTYEVGLWQAKAYRILKQHTNRILRERFDITSTIWALLGLLYDRSEPWRLTDVALELGVEAPFITYLVGKLQVKGLVSYRVLPSDRRTKLLALTPQGTHFVVQGEKIVRAEMKPLLQGVAPRDLVGYLRVLRSIINNDDSEQSDQFEKNYY